LCSSWVGSFQASRKLAYPKRAADVFGRPGSTAGDAAWVIDAVLPGFSSQFDDMDPAVSIVVFIEEDDRVVPAEREVDQLDVAGFEDLVVENAAFVELGGAVDQAADIEMVEVATGPSEACLQDFVELGEVERDTSQPKTADATPRLRA